MFFCGVLWQWAQNVNRDSFHENFHHILRKRSMSFPFLPKSTEGVLYTTMTCSRMIMMSFKFSLSKPLGKNNLAISQISSVTFPRLGQSTTFVRQQGLHDTTLRQHIFPQWFSISGLFPSKNNLPVLPSRRWKSRLVLT